MEEHQKSMKTRRSSEYQEAEEAIADPPGENVPYLKEVLFSLSIACLIEVPFLS